jgi:Transposase DDE domain
MKNSGNKGFDQHYNGQIAVDQQALLIIANTLSNHPNDRLDALPTVDGIDLRVGKPKRAALDTGYYSVTNIEGLEERQIEPYIATGRYSHQAYWQTMLSQQVDPPAAAATLKAKMAYKLQTEQGKAFYRLRKCTVEPIIGIIKETMGFRQFSLRGLIKAAGEWNLVCLAYNFRRLHGLMGTKCVSPTGC